MQYAKILIGNTSSGIIEAASFGKYVVNVGDRQKGRLQSDNVLNCDFEATAMITSVDKAISLETYIDGNVYFKQDVADNIIQIVKYLYENI
jgi:GDP/UDP-N,N'-diacetylbacillosamine 2-epimerase (hydrolysing)